MNRNDSAIGVAELEPPCAAAEHCVSGRSQAARVTATVPSLPPPARSLGRRKTDQLAPNVRVLCVDDDPQVVASMARHLGRRGLRVTSCPDPLSALALLRAQPDAFDVLLTDIYMPDMDGITLGLEARSIRPSLPVALISGNADERVERLAQVHAFDALMVKPVNPDELLSYVTERQREWEFHCF